MDKNLYLLAEFDQSTQERLAALIVRVASMVGRRRIFHIT